MTPEENFAVRLISLICMYLSLIGIAYLLKKRILYWQQAIIVIIWALGNALYLTSSAIRYAFGIELLSSDMIHAVSMFLRLYGAMSLLAVVIMTAYVRRAGDE